MGVQRSRGTRRCLVTTSPGLRPLVTPSHIIYKKKIKKKTTYQSGLSAFLLPRNGILYNCTNSISVQTARTVDAKCDANVQQESIRNEQKRNYMYNRISKLCLYFYEPLNSCPRVIAQILWPYGGFTR